MPEHLISVRQGLSEQEEARRGKLIAETLGLKPIKSGFNAGRYKTIDGIKTELGLFRVVERLMLDGE